MHAVQPFIVNHLASVAGPTSCEGRRKGAGRTRLTGSGFSCRVLGECPHRLHLPWRLPALAVGERAVVSAFGLGVVWVESPTVSTLWGPRGQRGPKSDN